MFKDFYVRGQRNLYLVRVDHWLEHYIHLTIKERREVSFFLFAHKTWEKVYGWDKHSRKMEFKKHPLDSEIRQMCEEAVRDYETRIKDAEQDNIKNLENELDLDDDK